MMPDEIAAALSQALRDHQAGRLEEAVEAYRRVLDDDAGNADALNLLASALRSRGEVAEATELARRAAQAAPERPDILYNCGNALSAAGDAAGAAAMYRDVLALVPDHADAAANLGIALAKAGDPDGAVAAYEQALALQPPHPVAGLNLGNLLGELGRHEASIALLRRMSLARSDLPEARYNLALGLLRHGDFTGGFAAYEARWRTADFSAKPRHQDRPAWDGKPFVGRKLLVHAEQGLGDTIQFVRLLPLAASLGGSITLEVPSMLKALLAGAAGADSVTDAVDAAAHDLQVPLLSLPLRLGLSLGSLPTKVPYLAARPERLERWRERLGDDGRRLIGLGWRGNPASPADKGRSLPGPALLAPLAQLADCRLVSLHKAGPDEIEEQDGRWRVAGLPFTIEHPGPDFDAGNDAFLDTAALMTLCDAVVTTDTSLAHLTGALARPSIVLLKAVADWRWLRERSDSPWYPTMTLVRQSDPGDFSGPIARAAELVTDLLDQAGARRAVKPI